MCPSPRTPDQSPVILGTSANLFKQLAMLCQETAGVDIAQTLGIRINGLVQSGAMVVGEGDDAVGWVKLKGPGSLTVPASSDCCAVCSVNLSQPLDKKVLILEDSFKFPLPAGVLLKTMAVPSSEIKLTQ